MTDEFLKDENLKNFAFYIIDGSKYLRTMGNTWFVSRLYNEKVDRNHLNWKEATSLTTKKSAFKLSKEFHKIWLHYIHEIAAANSMATNKIGLSADEIDAMVNALIAKMG